MGEDKKNKEGSYQIVFMVICLFGVILIGFYTDVMSRTFNLDEMQSIMDNAGLAALRLNIDEELLRAEEFVIDTEMAKSNYRRLVSENLDQLGEIESYEFVETSIESYKDRWGLGITSSAKEQYLLTSQIKVTLNNTNFLDTIAVFSKQYYNSRNGSTFTVAYKGKTEDGFVELSVRSVSRLVYR